MTPRQRIVVRRELADAEARGDHELVESLRADYDYDGVDTCAADGICATACPVLINTGDLVKRLRAESTGRVEERAWEVAAGHWDRATRAASTGLTLAARAPAPARAASRLGRRVAGDDTVPLYDPHLGRGGERREVLRADDAEAVLFSACVGTMFGTSGGLGADAALRALCERAGVRLRTPEDLPSLCCGTPWRSKGHHAGHARMATQVRASLDAATDGGRLPVVVDASSCAEGLLGLFVRKAPDTPGPEEPIGREVLDAPSFVRRHVLPRLQVTAPVPAVVVHPTCSSTVLGTTEDLVALARACSDDVRVPDAWGCCAFAGDRGLLHPELTASATAPESAEIATMDLPAGTAYVSGNRTCEIGMSRATGASYRHVLEVLEEATR